MKLVNLVVFIASILGVTVEVPSSAHRVSGAMSPPTLNTYVALQEDRKCVEVAVAILVIMVTAAFVDSCGGSVSGKIEVEGMEFGRGMDYQGCQAEAISRLKAAGESITEASSLQDFFLGCLKLRSER